MPLKLGAGFQDTSPWLLLFSPLPLPYFEKAIGEVYKPVLLAQVLMYN
jgi:hypothetical protein